MATGPQRARLDQALNGALDHDIDQSAVEWRRCDTIMEQIAVALLNASPAVKEEIGGQTGPAVDAAFTRSADGMRKKRADLAKGVQALNDAATVIRSARQEQQALAGQPLSEPAPYRAPSGQPTEQDLQEEAQSRQAHADYAAAFADQERRAKEQADRMDRVFEHSTAVMKDIHGIPDPEPNNAGAGGGVGGSGGGGGVSSAQGPGTPATAGPHGGRPPGAGESPGPRGPGVGPYQPGSGGGSVPGVGVGAPQGGGTPFDYTPGSGSIGGQVSTSPASTGLGVAGAAGGALGGGMLATGLAASGIRGGLSPVVASPGPAASSVRGIGATSRSGVTGALGRAGAAGPGAVGQTPASAARSAARSAGRGGVGGGARAGRGAGSAGSAGAAGAAGRRGKDDEKRRKHELFDVAEDWVDDEDAAPAVLD